MPSLADQSTLSAVDPEAEAFRALLAALCRVCRRQDIASPDDERLRALVERYRPTFPELTPELIAAALAPNANEAPVPRGVAILERKGSADASAVTGSTEPWGAAGRSASPEGHEAVLPSTNEHDNDNDDNNDNANDNDNEDLPSTKKEPAWWFAFRAARRANRGYNPLTYAALLSGCAILAFLASVLLTHLSYNRAPYRDWALAGGVTSTSAAFRVRGPASDDGGRRDFVVSANPNLALARDRLLTAPVAHGDFAPDEHSVKRLALATLAPRTTYYYGIVRPRRAANSAEVAGDVGRFTTPAREGSRMDFRIATGSCALTGSESPVFERVLETEPLLFLHTGDLHYEDLGAPDVDARLAAYDRVLGSAAQRRLYTRTIFAYMWDDHDWLGNNADGEDAAAATAAKRAYTLGVPHYPLGSPAADEASAAKYQAFTVGTVRFLLTDLRSEAVRSSAYYAGKAYGKEQKRWLFNELSRADRYDFVVWVTTRPWTDPDALGSDGWGGFVPDRDELAAHIAATVGAGPRNLLVLSGDNHMVAFDDGSNTDYSGQRENPGGFPLLHSGPLTNYGALSDLFRPTPHRFTEGCKAYSHELNHQFSTVDFRFPSAAGRGCVTLRSYSADSSDVIFEKEMCGDLMRRGTPEADMSELDTCTLPRFSVPTQAVLIAAGALVVLGGVLSLWFLGLDGGHLAARYLGLGAGSLVLTVAAAAAGALCLGTRGVNIFALAAFLLAQSLLGALFVGNAVYEHCASREADKDATKGREGKGDIEAGSASIDKDGDRRNEVVEGNEDTTFECTIDDALHLVSTERAAAGCDDAASSATGGAAPVESSAPRQAGEASMDESRTKNSAGGAAPTQAEATARAKSASRGSIGNAAATKAAKGRTALAPEKVDELMAELDSFFEGYSASCSGNSIAPAAGPRKGNSSDEDSAAALLCGGDRSASPFEEKVASVLSSARHVSLPAVPEGVAALLSGQAFARSKSLQALRASLRAPRAHRSFRDLDDRAHPPTPDADEGIEITNPTTRGYCFNNTSNLVEM